MIDDIALLIVMVRILDYSLVILSRLPQTTALTSVLDFFNDSTVRFLK